MHNLDKQVWENRHTTRLFSEEHTIIPDDDLEYLQTVINHVPSQCSIKSHFWIYLGRSERDMKLRTWLADNVFWLMDDDTNIKESMLGVIQAPAILLSVMCSDPWANPEEGKDDEDHRELAIRSEGLFAGVILSTLLNMNYQVATFGCTAGMVEDRETKDEEFNTMLKATYSKELTALTSKYPGRTGNWEDIKFYPNLATCFGPVAIDKLSNPSKNEFDTWTSSEGKEYRFINGAKLRTPAATCIGFPGEINE